MHSQRLKPLGCSRLPYVETNLAYKLLLSWTDLNRVYEANREKKKVLERHSEMNYMKTRERMFRCSLRVVRFLAIHIHNIILNLYSFLLFTLMKSLSV